MKDRDIQNLLDLGKLKGMYGKRGQNFIDQINNEFFMDKDESEQPSKVETSMTGKIIDNKWKETLTAKISFEDGRILNLEYKE